MNFKGLLVESCLDSTKLNHGKGLLVRDRLYAKLQSGWVMLIFIPVRTNVPIVPTKNDLDVFMEHYVETTAPSFSMFIPSSGDTSIIIKKVLDLPERSLNDLIAILK